MPLPDANAVLTGGCFCGAIRYHSQQPLIDAGYCHCHICQKTCGAPLVAWVSVPQVGFKFIQGTPTQFRSSPRGIRYFCSICGSQMTFCRPGGTEVDINTATLDDPAAISPQYHIWTADQIRWLQLSDGLPRYLDNGPDR